MKADVLLGLQWGDEGKGKISNVKRYLYTLNPTTVYLSGVTEY